MLPLLPLDADVELLSLSDVDAAVELLLLSVIFDVDVSMLGQPSCYHENN